MSAAFGIAMFAVAISLGVVFMTVRTNKAAIKKRDNGDGATGHSSGSSNDCSLSDGGGCDGGGGGD